MRIKLKGFLLFCTALLMFLSCSKGLEVAGGTEAGNAKVAGKVVFDNGESASGRVVELRDIIIKENGDSVVGSMSSVTDSCGRYSFYLVSPGKYVLYCRDEESGKKGIITECEVEDTPAESSDIVLKETSVVRGRVNTPEGVNPGEITVFVPGTGICAVPDTSGEYLLSGVPKTGLSLLFSYRSALNYLYIPLDGTEEDTVNMYDVDFSVTAADASGEFSYYKSEIENSFKIEPSELGGNAVLIDDFEDNTRQNALGGVLYSAGNSGAGMWDVWPLSTHDLIPSGFPDEFSEALVSEGAFSGSSLRLTFDVDELEGSRPGVYVNLGDGSYNLSEMESLSFYTKGTGSYRVAFQTDTVGYEEGAFIYEFTCNGSWQKVVVDTADIIPEPGSITESNGLKWQDASTGVNAISIFVLEDCTLWLDEIYLNGLVAENL